MIKVCKGLYIDKSEIGLDYVLKFLSKKYPHISQSSVKDVYTLICKDFDQSVKVVFEWKRYYTLDKQEESDVKIILSEFEQILN